MDAVIAFVVAAIISFWGSLQLGLVNVAVIETTLHKGRTHGIWLAIGGVLPEIPYTLIAIFGANYVDKIEEYKQDLGIAVGLILLGLGLFYFFKKPTYSGSKKGVPTSSKSHSSFIKGFLLALANPQLIFFWSGILILIKTNSFNFFKHKEVLIDFNQAAFVSPRITFALGAALGALGILLLYIRLTTKYRERLLAIVGNRLGKIVGVLFILIGVIALIRNVI